jgi:nucleoside-diphosphate-sugar epimerase
MPEKTVFLTGATGSMGGSALRHLLRQGRCRVVVLVRPSARNREVMKPYEQEPGLTVVWGDLTEYEDVLRCVTGAQVVLHPAAFIAPAADHDPPMAWKINVGSARNIVRAIQAQPDPDAVRLINVGTVAATGDRLPPIHVGRTGDPLKPSIFDMYACSKIEAERIVAESGLKHWVSCRQTYIATSRQIQDPIMFHQPIQTCIELCTEHDAGLLLANACEDDLPEEFWRRFYNIGGGPGCRTVFATYLERTMELFGIEYRKVVDRNWFATRNFHCQWFEDSGVLDRTLHFQTESLEDHIRHIRESIPPHVRDGARGIPHEVIREKVMLPLASATPDATLYWIHNNMEGRISAFFKSREDWARIPADWETDLPEDPWKVVPVRLDHGYDENKPSEELDLADMQGAARFRGGRCRSGRMTPGDLHSMLSWECAFGHAFDATPNLVLRGGHWCPTCAPPGWNYDEEARRNPFFSQVWTPNHDRDEHHVYPEDCWKDMAREKESGAS